MKYIPYYLFTLLALFSLQSCDEGDILDEVYVSDTEYYTVKFAGHITGCDSWSDGYDVVLAAYNEESDYSVIQKQITNVSIKDGYVTLVLPNIPTDAKTIEFGIANRLRRRIATFESLAIDPAEMSTSDTIYFELKTPMNVGQFSTIQREVFDGANYNCSMCHGSNNGRANLDLSEGNSHQNLVNVASSRIEGGIRVLPGNTIGSVLHDVLAEGNPTGLRYDHSNLLDDIHKRLIDDWIDHGATE